MNTPINFRFENREEAGELLAEKLRPIVQEEKDLLILGLPRGGVPVAYQVAKSLDAPLDVLAVRKLGIPGYEETAMGAIAFGGFQFLNEETLSVLGLSEEVIQSVIEKERRELQRRETAYRGDRPPLALEGRTVVLVDDGIATGSTVRVALRFLREAKVRKIIVACPVCAASTLTVLEQEADEVVCVLVPSPFVCVGAWYHDFSATSDEEVCQIMASLTKNPGKPKKSSLPKTSTVETIREQVQPLLGVSTDYDLLLEMIGESSVILLGEASHGTHEFYRERAEITKRLVEERGFDAVLIEGDCPDTHRIHQYVCGWNHDQESIESLAGFERFPAWMWRNADVLNFIGWLRDHNEHQSESEKLVGIFGLDLYSMHKSMNEVVDYLEEIDPPAAERARYRYLCLERFGENPQDYGLIVGRGVSHGCEDQVIGQLKELRAKEAKYLEEDGPVMEDKYFIAEQNARSVKNAEQYYRAMFHSGAESWNMRDDHMMETLLAVRKHLTKQRGQAKVVVWAHNSHLGDARHTSMGRRGERNLGQMVRETYGRDSRLIGMTTYSGTVTAAQGWHLPPQRRHVRPGCEGSIERLFHSVKIPRFYLPLNDDNPAAMLLGEPRLQRAIGVIYRPETERQSHYFTAALSKQFDAIIHIDETRAVEPLEKSNQWVKGELPESYPTGI